MIWRDLEDERRAICKLSPASKKLVYGSQDSDVAEQISLDGSCSKLPILAAKPSMFGAEGVAFSIIATKPSMLARRLQVP